MKKVNTKLTYTNRNTHVIEIVTKSIVKTLGFFYVFYC